MMTYRLTDDDMEIIRKHIVHSKLQQRALLHTGISYGKFRSVLDTGTGLTRQQYQKLLAFCRQAEQNSSDF